MGVSQPHSPRVGAGTGLARAWHGVLGTHWDVTSSRAGGGGGGGGSPAGHWGPPRPSTAGAGGAVEVGGVPFHAHGAGVGFREGLSPGIGSCRRGWDSLGSVPRSCPAPFPPLLPLPGAPCPQDFAPSMPTARKDQELPREGAGRAPALEGSQESPALPEHLFSIKMGR